MELTAEPEPFPSLSPRQLETLLFVARAIRQTRRSPTVREICHAIGLNTTNCSLHVEPLVRKGYLAKIRNRNARNLRLTRIGQKWFDAQPEVTVRRLSREDKIEVQTRRIISDPDILSGAPVFLGTRVPVKNLTDYLEAGDSIEEFLFDFPSVREEA
jgi:uncharacterized protein (DUF433 family)